MKMKFKMLKILAIMAIVTLIVNGVVIFRTFYQGSSISSVIRASDDPAEMADRASPGSYIEINTTTDFSHASSR